MISGVWILWSLLGLATTAMATTGRVLGDASGDVS